MNPITQESLELLKGALARPNNTLAKSISTATGLVAYDLQAPAKNLYPFVTPLRNVMPRVGGGTGSATNWRQVNAIIGSGFDSMGWVPEGQRSGQMSYSTSNKSATYVTIGEEDAATFEAISAGREFEDIQARMTFRLLQKMMLKEEMAILAGNASLQLGTPATPIMSVADTGATLPTGTYYVKIVALTLEGYQNSSTLGGVATSMTVTGADGRSYMLSGGSSNISAEASQAVTLGETLSCTVTPVQGAVAFAWYVSTASGAETLQAITTINSLAISAPLSTGNQAQTAINADNSANVSYAYDGLLTTALKPGSNAYVNIMPTGAAGTGTPPTASGRGSVVEIDSMFQTMWDNFELSPTVLYVNSQELKNITSKVLSNASGPLLRFDSPADGSQGEYQVTASGGCAVLLQSVRNQWRSANPNKNPSPCAAWHDHRVDREPAYSIPVERSTERGRNKNPTGLLSDRLAACYSPAPGRCLCRRSAGRLCAICDGRDLQHRQRLNFGLD